MSTSADPAVEPFAASRADAGPPLRPPVPTNVPAALSALVGRASERETLQRLLDDARLVTLTGPGGVGKTRLARETAAAAALAPAAPAGGVWWVELAPVAAPADVPGAVASVLQLRASPERDVTAALAEALHGRRVLLVLDNCEHVVDAAAALAEALLRACPGLTILATSREALGVEGEAAWVVPPLAHPAQRPTAADRGPASVRAADVAAYDAVRLFVSRARASVPAFALTDGNAASVAAITARLDGLPLALELAAASVGLLGVDALAARLDDAFAVLTRGRRTARREHQTLRALLDWSYARLAEPERRLLRRLTVFRGAFTLDAAVAVCADADDAAGAAVLEPFGRLVEQSLVDVRDDGGEVRYRLLETVRQYGAALLRGTPDERATRARHAAWVAAAAAEAEPRFWSPARGQTIGRLQNDLDEIRAALAWATGPHGDAAVALGIAAPLAWFWFSGVAWGEARRWTTAVLAALDAAGVPDAARPPADRARIAALLYAVAGLAYFAGAADESLAGAERALALWDGVDADAPLPDALRLPAARGRAVMLQLAGLAHAARRELEPAVARMDAALAVAEARGDAWLAAVMRVRRALVLDLAGERTAAAADYARAADALRAIGERWFLSFSLAGLAENAFAAGDLPTAAAHARDGVAVLRPEPDRWFIARALDLLATVAATAPHGASPDPARAEAAARLLGAAAGLRARCGAEVLGRERARHASTVAAARGALAPAAFDAAWADGESLELDDVFALAATADVAVHPAHRAAALPPAPATPPPAAAPALAVRALGLLVVTRAGVPLDASAWHSGKVKELLLFLLLNPPRTKEQIGLALWPDASTAQLRNAFHITLHHLRRALGGREWVAFADGAYHLDRAPTTALALQADVDLVLGAADRARQAVRRQLTLPDAEVAALRAALTDARGEIGEGVTAGDWLVEHQDRVRGAWADGVAAVARLLSARGAHDDAVELYQALLARDPLREAAHRDLMRAYAAAGEPARALRHHDELVALLRREVGAAPARETAALVEQLRRQG